MVVALEQPLSVSLHHGAAAALRLLDPSGTVSGTSSACAPSPAASQHAAPAAAILLPPPPPVQLPAPLCAALPQHIAISGRPCWLQAAAPADQLQQQQQQQRHATTGTAAQNLARAIAECQSLNELLELWERQGDAMRTHHLASLSLRAVDLQMQLR